MLAIKEESLKEYLKSKSFDDAIYDEIVALSNEIQHYGYGVVHTNEDEEIEAELTQDIYEEYEEAYEKYKQYSSSEDDVWLTQIFEVVLMGSE